MAKLTISLFFGVFLFGCATSSNISSSQEKNGGVLRYKVVSTGSVVKVGYSGMPESDAQKLLQNFEGSGGRYKNVVELLSKDKERSLSLRAECSGGICQYVVDSFVPCAESMAYYFKINDESFKFEFVSSLETMEEFCSPTRSWLSRLFNL